MKLADIPAPLWQLAAYVVGGMLLLHLARRFGAQAAQAINPTNPDNIFAASVNSAGAALSGRDDWSLGVRLYELTHPNELENGP